MTIREVLNADWTVSWFEVDVREIESTKMIRTYLIGKGVKPARHARFIEVTAAGDIYKDGQHKVVVTDKVIQFRQLPKRPQGKEMCVGVLIEDIPRELLDLDINYMHPSGCGCSDDMHGYRFTCYTDYWNGITGENEQMELDLK